MILEIKVPTVGESINEVTLSRWIKKEGDYVQQDEVLCELESDKATFELNAEKSGVLKPIIPAGEVIKIGTVVCSIDTDAPPPANLPVADVVVTAKAEKQTAPAHASTAVAPTPTTPAGYAVGTPSPSAAKMMAENSLDTVPATGRDGRITKADVINAIKQGHKPVSKEPAQSNSRNSKREKMTSLRKTISKHLVQAKNQTAMLTTFNEVDMKPIMDIRARHKESFQKKHNIGLGFMGFFTKAVCNALSEWPAVNAMIDGDEIIYNNYCDISIAVSTPKGLTTPVIRNAESMTLAEIEMKVAELAKKGRDNKLTLDEMSGGTFTISNGGVFGSLMSTPIINIPQSAILGMHKIQDRPVAIDGQVVIRPMMYLALSYDHRIIDGRESVSFLVRVKEQLENPEQLLVGADPVKLLLNI
ncbi:MAG: 2-oxoglutarate dehydrogenase complex dihydrolipoyllysine-residue succinyltransferase [Bacteroidota bacterium]